MRSVWKALLDAARAKRSQSSGAAPEESNGSGGVANWVDGPEVSSVEAWRGLKEGSAGSAATKRSLSTELCRKGRARKGPQSSAAAPEESNATKRSLSRGLCRKGRARKGPRALGRLRKSLTCYQCRGSPKAMELIRVSL